MATSYPPPPDLSSGCWLTIQGESRRGGEEADPKCAGLLVLGVDAVIHAEPGRPSPIQDHLARAGVGH